MSAVLKPKEQPPRLYQFRMRSLPYCEARARRVLALHLARGNVDLAHRIRQMPLFEVALDGVEGLAAAEGMRR